MYKYLSLSASRSSLGKTFDDDYAVKIFKVVNLDSNYLDFLAQRSGTSVLA